MAWKPVTTNAIDIKKEPNKAFVGHYQGKTDTTTKIGPQVIYNFIDEEAKPFSIYGFTNLNRSMEGVSKDALVRITYQGTKNVQTRFGMKDVHQVLVEVNEADDDPHDLSDVFPPEK